MPDAVLTAPSTTVDPLLLPPFNRGTPEAIAFLSARSLFRLEELLRANPHDPLVDAWWRQVNDEWEVMIRTYGEDSHEAEVAGVNVTLTFRTIRGVVSKRELAPRASSIIVQGGTDDGMGND